MGCVDISILLKIHFEAEIGLLPKYAYAQSPEVQGEYLRLSRGRYGLGQERSKTFGEPKAAAARPISSTMGNLGIFRNNISYQTR